jgi:hypothetical protein
MRSKESAVPKIRTSSLHSFVNELEVVADNFNYVPDRLLNGVAASRTRVDRHFEWILKDR